MKRPNFYKNIKITFDKKEDFTVITIQHRYVRILTTCKNDTDMDKDKAIYNFINDEKARNTFNKMFTKGEKAKLVEYFKEAF